MIKADSEDDARTKANELGLSEEHSYGVEGGVLTWRFDRVERVYAIDDAELGSGTELFSRFLRESEVLSILTPFDD